MFRPIGKDLKSEQTLIESDERFLLRKVNEVGQRIAQKYNSTFQLIEFQKLSVSEWVKTQIEKDSNTVSCGFYYFVSRSDQKNYRSIKTDVINELGIPRTIEGAKGYEVAGAYHRSFDNDKCH